MYIPAVALARRVGVTACVLATLSSCSITVHQGGITRDSRAIPVQADARYVDSILPEDFVLEEGEVVRRQTYSLDTLLPPSLCCFPNKPTLTMILYLFKDVLKLQ